MHITGFANLVNDSNDRKSYSGFIFMSYIFMSNGPTSSEVRKQRTVAFSSTEAEYVSYL